MQPTTPKGWRMVIAHLSRNSLGTVSPNARRPWPAMNFPMSMASCTSPRASVSTLPISRVMSCASASLRSSSSSEARRMIAARDGHGVRRQASNASRAAATAASTSAASLRGNTPTTSSLSRRVARLEGAPSGGRPEGAADQVSDRERGFRHRHQAASSRIAASRMSRPASSSDSGIVSGGISRITFPSIPQESNSTPRASALAGNAVDELGCGSLAVLHELEADHHPKAAHVRECGNVVLPAPCPFHHAAAEPLGSLRDVIASHRLDDGDRGCAGDCVATVGGAVLALVERAHHAVPGDDRCDGHPVAERLGKAHDVGLHAGVVDREHPPGATEPALHLVGDQQDAVLVADTTQHGHERRRRDDVAALALHGLDDDGGDGLRARWSWRRAAPARARPARRHRRRRACSSGSSTDSGCGARPGATVPCRDGRWPCSR